MSTDSAESAGLLHLAAAALDDVLFVTDLQGRVLDANPAAGLFLGQPALALRGQLLAHCAREVARGAFVEGLERALPVSFTESFECSVQRDGQERIWEVSVRRAGAAEAVNCRIVHLHDVTDRVMAARLLSTREHNQRLLMDHMRELLFLLRIEAPGVYRCELVNGAYLTATGLREEQIVGRQPHELLGPTEATAAIARYEQAQRAEGPLVYRESAHLAGGHFVVETRLTVLRDPDGLPTHILGLARNMTDEEAATLALRESEHRLRGVIEVGLDAFVMVAAVRAVDGAISRFDILDVNERAARMVMRRRDELLGRSLMDVYPASRDLKLWDQCCTVLITGEPLETTQFAPTDEQPMRWLQRQLVPVGNATVAISSRDITPRYLEHLALEESEERHRQLFESNGAIQLLADVESSRIIDVNPAAVEFYGWPRETMRAMYVTDLESTTLDHWRETTSDIATGTGLRVPRDHRVANGALRQVEAFIGVVAITKRRVLHIIIQDTTDRVRAERQLRESEARFRAVIAGMQEGVVLHDDTGAVRAYNPSAERILGQSGAQLLGLKPLDPDWQAMHEDGTPWPSTEQPAFVALRSGESQPRALMGVQRGNGPVSWLNVSADPLMRSGEQRPYAAVAVFTDVTDARGSEERLRQAQKLEAVAQLAGGIAHDFNNLLTVIRGSASFVREGVGETSPYIDDLDAIERATDRAEELTRRLLAVGRRQMLRAESVELNSLLNAYLPVLRDRIPLSVSLRLALTPKPVFAMVDRTRLLDAIRAVVDNALSAMEAGGVLTLTTATVTRDHAQSAPVDAPQEFAMLSVHDTGTGMSDDIRMKLFEPFFSTQEFGANRGMGLASVHGLVHQSRGFIECDSTPSEGTTLRLFFPATSAQSSPVKSTPPSVEAIDTALHRILLVDDDPMLLELGKRLLTKLGHTVVVSPSAAQALDILALHAKDVTMLITDLTMPEMNGLELIDAVRLRYEWLPMVAVSGFSVNPRARAELDLRRVPFVGKPFTSTELLAAITKAASRAPVRSE